jgi:serine/threonine protein kinase
VQPAPLEKRERLADRYDLDRQIGEGGMGAVYVAFDAKEKRRVAVKVLIALDDDKLRARFEQEARATMELAHPNIVRVTDFHAPPDKPPFLVMELLEGESLRDRMKREKRLTIEDAVRIAIELCEALAHAHAAGVIHRDVKPPNVFLVKPEGRVKLLDFGIAKVRAEFGKVHTTTGTVLGTPSYFAPEQLLAKEIDGRTDVHAVGIVLYEMLSGQRPFMEENPVDLTAAILHRAPPPLEKLRPDVPKELVLAVHDALAKDRFSRPTASELAKRLAPFAPRRPSRLAPFFVVALAGAAAAAAFAYRPSEEPSAAERPRPTGEPVIVAAEAAAVDASPGGTETVNLDAAAALAAEADELREGGFITRERDLLKRAVKAGAADASILSRLGELCDAADDIPCKEMLTKQPPQ